MKIATILYTYNRDVHTEKVINALQNNTELPEKLFVFQDGLNNDKDQEGWKRTKDLIDGISWCNCEIIVSDSNKGLAQSIISGLDYVFTEYDAAIVLEDDCVPHPLFMKYMKSALVFYERMNKVYSIGGCDWPVEVEPNGTDTYFTKRISSWGWATWKNRWKFFEQDYRILGRIKKNPYLLKQFHIWAEDVEHYLLGNVYGYCNSWAAFWALIVLEQDGFCVAPYQSLIENIGFDGSGVHCGTNKVEMKMLSDENKKDFIFCDDFSISEQTEMNFTNYLAWTSTGEKNTCYYHILLKWMNLHTQKKTVNDYLIKNNIDKICIWGKGKICELLLEELDEKVDILGIVESKPSQEMYYDIPIVDVKSIPLDTQLVIIIPEYDMDKIVRMLKTAGHNGDIVGISGLLVNI